MMTVFLMDLHGLFSFAFDTSKFCLPHRSYNGMFACFFTQKQLEIPPKHVMSIRVESG
jgi:hypothetical protein